MPAATTPPRLPDVIVALCELIDETQALVVEIDADETVRCSSPSPATFPTGQFLTGSPPSAHGLCLVIPRPTVSSRPRHDATSAFSHVGTFVDRHAVSISFGVRNGATRAIRSDRAGVLNDLALRRLRLPTPPPVIGTGWYWSVCWIVEMLDHLRRLGPGELLDAPECALLHPAVDAADRLPSTSADLTARIVAAHRRHVAVWRWERLRHAAIDSALAFGVCQPALAGQLDAGAFSRLLPTSFPPVADRLPPMIRSLTYEAQRLVGAVLADVLVDRRWVTIANLLDDGGPAHSQAVDLRRPARPHRG